jgi:RimJ/RimL family protein N-acetyltransferase
MSAIGLTNRELLHIQLRTAFILDAQGRLAAVNEPGQPAAPRIFVAGAGQERIVRVRSDIPELIARAWLASEDEKTLMAKVAAHSPIQREHRGPAYVLPQLRPRDDDVVFVREGPGLHPELVARGWRLTEADPYVGVVRDDQIVAVCYSSRDGAEACEAGVETASTYRAQGLGELAVRTWAAMVQRSGRLALYSTAWDNAASQRIAAKLGAEQYGENWHLT